MALDLITGHQGVAHISAEQISDINKAMMNGFGDNKVMRMTGGAITQNALALEIATGYWRANGFDIQIQESETHYIDPSTIGTSRIDNIYVELLQDIPTGAQRAEITIIMGEESASPVAPEDPTEPYLNTDILLDAVQIGTVTVTEGAMVFTDLTEEYDLVTPSELAAVRGMIQDDSDAYSSSKAYAVGNLCIHDDVVYKCITACSAAAWSVNQNCFSATTLMNSVTTLNSDLSGKVLATVMGDGVANISGLLNTLFPYIPSDVSIGRIALRYGQNEYRCTNASSDGTSYQFSSSFISLEGNNYYTSTYIVKAADSKFYRMENGTVYDLSSNIYDNGKTIKIIVY